MKPMQGYTDYTIIMCAKDITGITLKTILNLLSKHVY